VATEIAERTLSLPLSPALSDRDQADVVAALQTAFDRSDRRSSTYVPSAREGIT
jgi:hypothetical protein